MEASASPTFAVKCERRSGLIRVILSSSLSVTSRTTRATSFSSTPPTKPVPSSLTASFLRTPRSTKPTLLVRERMARPTSSSATLIQTMTLTMAPLATRRRSTLTTFKLAKALQIPFSLSPPSPRRYREIRSYFAAGVVDTVFSLKPEAEHPKLCASGPTTVVAVES